MKRRKTNQKGFTLVELVIVVAILAVLVTLLVPRILGNVEEAKKNTEIGNARTIASEIAVWNAKSLDAAKVKDSNNDGIIRQGEYTAKLTMPVGVNWPSATNAVIKMDAAGNPYVDITAPTPIPTPAGP